MEAFWRFIYDLFDPLTDNVYLIIVFISIAAAFLLSVLQCGISKIINKNVYIAFGPLSMLFTYIVSDMTVRLPVLHPRMHLALSTVAGILDSSQEYSAAFEKASGITIQSSQSIASYLYRLTETEQSAWVCRPSQLYDSLFRTMDQIRSGALLPDVHQSCLGSWNIIFVAAVVLMVLMTFVLFTGNQTNGWKIIWHILSCSFLIWMCSITSGAALCAMLMWICSVFLVQLKK